MNNTETLLKLKKDIDESKIKKAQLEGKLQTFEEQLKKEYNYNSVEEVEKIVKEIETDIKNNEIEFEKGLNEIKELL